MAQPWERPAALTDRLSERRALDQLVGAVRAGGSRALVVRGDPGVGKSVLLDHLAAKASGSGCRVAGSRRPGVWPAVRPSQMPSHSRVKHGNELGDGLFLTQLRVPQAQLLLLWGAAPIVQIRIAGGDVVRSALADQ